MESTRPIYSIVGPFEINAVSLSVVDGQVRPRGDALQFRLKEVDEQLRFRLLHLREDFARGS